MKHEEIKGKIVAFIDGETSEAQKDEIVAHIASCKSCENEYQALMGMDSYMKNTGDISLPAFFREKLMRKISVAREKRFEFGILKLIPASAALAVIVLFASAFIAVSPYIYAGDNQEMPKQVAQSLKFAVITCMTSSVFSPAVYAAFCDKCSETMCAQCMAKNPDHKCQCGGHKHGN